MRSMTTCSKGRRYVHEAFAHYFIYSCMAQHYRLNSASSCYPTPADNPQVIGPPNPVADWLPNSNWQAVLALKEISDYQALPEDLVSSSKRWKEWLEMPRPEAEPLPGEQVPAEALSSLCSCKILRANVTVHLAAYGESLNA